MLKKWLGLIGWVAVCGGVVVGPLAGVGVAGGPYDWYCDGSSTEYFNAPSCVGDRLETSIGRYDTYQEAYDAGSAWWTDGYWATGLSTGVDGMLAVGSNKTVSNNGCGGTQSRAYFYYTTTGYGSCSGPVTDTDGDGLDDNIDPYPSDNSPFGWRKWIEIRDSNGVLKATGVRTDRGDNFWLGDVDFANDCVEGTEECKKRLIITYGDEYPNGSDEWLSLFEGSEIGEGGPTGESGDDVIDGERQVTPASGIEEGESSEVGDSDSELLRKIVDNTSRTASNMQTLADRLKAIEAETRYSNTGAVGGSSGGDSQGVQAGVSGALEAYGDNVQSEVESENEAGIAGLEGVGTLDPYTEDDAPEKTTLASIWDSWLGSNPVSTLLGDSGVELSAATCSFSSSITFLGISDDIDFSFCDWSDTLDLLGGWVYGIAMLSGLILLATGKI